MFCPKCGGELPDIAKFCGYCGQKLEKSGNRKQNSAKAKNSEKKLGRMPVKRLVITILIAVLGCCACLAILVYFDLFHILHDWQEATCTGPKTCSVCGKTEGEALGHTWEEATCIKPKTCNVCGGTEGEALGHDWKEATCTEPKTCSVCKETEGKTLEHNWQAATCQEPSTCSLCGETTGELGDHQWKDATCLELATCIVCGETTGSYAEHGMGDDGYCPVCGEQVGVLLTNDNVQQYLSVKCRDNTIEITPCYSNAHYVNVSLSVYYTYIENSGDRNSSRSTVVPNIDVSSDGYGSSSTPSVGPGGRTYTATGIERVIVGKDSYVLF